MQESKNKVRISISIETLVKVQLITSSKIKMQRYKSLILSMYYMHMKRDH